MKSLSEAYKTTSKYAKCEKCGEVFNDDVIDVKDLICPNGCGVALDRSYKKPAYDGIFCNCTLEQRVNLPSVDIDYQKDKYKEILSKYSFNSTPVLCNVCCLPRDGATHGVQNV